MDTLIEIMRPFGRFVIFIPLLAVIVKQSRGQKYGLCAAMFLFGAAIWAIEGAMCLYMGLSEVYFAVGDPYRQMMILLGAICLVAAAAWVYRGAKELMCALRRKDRDVD